MSTRCPRGPGSVGLPRSPGTGTASASPLPEEPYPSLSFYDRRHRALLAGRDDDVERFAMFLDDASTRILVLHGESRVGKSSFVRAGVIPYLEEECLGYRFKSESSGDASAASRSPVVYVRATNDLLAQLASISLRLLLQALPIPDPAGR